MFESRHQAGELLAIRLKKYAEDSVVIAIPRGGVVIGAEICKQLKCSLDVIIIRKLGAPGNPELAIGATTSKGGVFLDRDLIDKLDIPSKYVHEEHSSQLVEARRRENMYLSARSPGDPDERHGVKVKAPDLAGKTAILVDDGIATGSTMEAAIHTVGGEMPKKIVIAIPVAPKESVERLKRDVDDFVVLETPEPFHAIGEFYVDFPQVSDEEVIDLLQRNQKAQL